MKGATRPRSPAQSYLPHSTCPSRLPRARWCRGTTVVEFTALPGRRGAPWIGPRSPLFLYLDCPGQEGESIGWARAVHLAGGN